MMVPMMVKVIQSSIFFPRQVCTHTAKNDAGNPSSKHALELHFVPAHIDAVDTTQPLAAKSQLIQSPVNHHSVHCCWHTHCCCCCCPSYPSHSSYPFRPYCPSCPSGPSCPSCSFRLLILLVFLVVPALVVLLVFFLILLN